MSVLTNSINLETAQSYGPTFLGNWDLNSWKRQQIFLFSTASISALGTTQPDTSWVPRPLMLKVIWPRCEADHWPQSSAGAKNACSCICITSHIFMTLSKHSYGQLYLYKILPKAELCCHKEEAAVDSFGWCWSLLFLDHQQLHTGRIFRCGV